MYKFTSNETPDSTELRARLQAMSDKQLREFGKAAANMCSKEANPDEPPRPVFVVQLEEARKEWKRRQNAKKAHKSKPTEQQI